MCIVNLDDDSGINAIVIDCVDNTHNNNWRTKQAKWSKNQITNS